MDAISSIAHQSGRYDQVPRGPDEAAFVGQAAIRGLNFLFSQSHKTKGELRRRSMRGGPHGEQRPHRFSCAMAKASDVSADVRDAQADQMVWSAIYAVHGIGRPLPLGLERSGQA